MPHALDVEGLEYFPAATLRAQVAACLSAWGMPAQDAETTAAIIVDADECGIDTHGMALLASYDKWRREGRLTMDGRVEVLRDTPVSALVDGGGSLGYMPSMTATKLAIAKAQDIGLAAVAVRNSAHFGAAGYYTRLMTTAGLVGFATTNGSGPQSSPTYGRDAKLSTNPLAFSAPAARNPPFALDMATTTVAGGKVRIRANERMEMPVGWANGVDGTPLTDAHEYWNGKGGTLTPLGGTPEGASYKGYGLGVMVEILSAALSGASLVTSPNHARRTPGSMEVGHFFLALSPTLFRDDGEFQATVDALLDDLHATRPVTPEQPVLVAGEPENLARTERKQTGIPVPPGLREQIRQIATGCGAPFFLE